jgi:hypothetical protein
MPLSKSLSGDFDFSQLKQNWMGHWSEDVIYKINDTVRLNGKAYVCNSNYFLENGLFGVQHKPGIDSDNWSLVVNGTVYKGDWAYKDRHYVGDIVRYNEDYYQCTVDNFGGHPIYENGNLSNKWVKIAETSKTDKTRNHVWFANYPPIGWTKNMCETVEQYGNPGSINQAIINGDYELMVLGDMQSKNGYGLGERVDWTRATGSSTMQTYTNPRSAGFDMWDWLDNVLPSPSGAEPRIIQVTGTDNYTLVLFDNGEVYHSGSGSSGESGDSTNNSYSYFRRVGRSTTRGTGVLRTTKIVKVGHNSLSGYMNTSQGQHSCFALDNQGRVWVWGWNGFGQLGLGNTTNVNTPTQIPQAWFHNKKIADMWMAGNTRPFVYALTEDGDLYSWGNNFSGVLGNGHFRNQHRPERVKYNWKLHGGVKKVILTNTDWDQSSTEVNNAAVVVLTNDGQLHMVGSAAKSLSGASLYGAGAIPPESFSTFHQAAKLYSTINKNQLGVGSKIKHISSMIDVMNDIEDFWLIGDGFSISLVMKQRSTNMLYAVGNNNYWIPVYNKEHGVVMPNSENPMNGTNNISYPTPLETGNMKDIKYVHRFGTESSVSVCFLNSDGRLWTNARNYFYAKGLGSNVTNSQHLRGSNNKLPWEHWFRNTTIWSQPRIAEPVSMLTGVGYSSSGGWGIITTNGRYMFAGGGFDWWYGWDAANNNPTAALQSTYNNGNFLRTTL